MKNKIKFRFIIPIWNKNYIKECFQNTIASLLSRNNLFSLDPKKINIIFCTRLIDVDFIKKQKLFKVLEKHFKLDFIFIDKIFSEKKRRILHYAFYEGYKSVKEKKDSCFINLNSDDIFSDGSIKYIQKFFKIKNFCIFNSPIHCDLKKFHQILFKYKKNGIIKIPSLDLQKISLMTMSRFCKNSIFKNNYIKNLNPYYILFDFKDYMLKKSILCHPLVFRTQFKITKLKSFMDYAIYPQYVKNGRIIKNLPTEKFFKITPNNTNKKQYNFTTKKYTLNDYSKFTSGWALNYHTELFKGYEILYKNNHIKKITKKDKKFLKNITRIISKNLLIKNSFKNHPHWGTDHNYHNPRAFKNKIKKFLGINN